MLEKTHLNNNKGNNNNNPNSSNKNNNNKCPKNLVSNDQFEKSRFCYYFPFY